MILADLLFKPRKLPGRWLRFTEANPVLPNVISVAVLAWICYSLAIIINASEKHGNGQFIETINVVANSKPLVEKAIDVRTAYHHFFPEEIRNLAQNLYGNLALYLVVPLLLLLELLFPCNPAQPLISKGFLQDAIWYIVFTPLTLLIIYPIIGFLHGLFDQHLSFLSVNSAAAWPVFLQIMAAMLLAEFFIWFNHYIRHKIHTLWLFHAVHHSQKELNIFTDDRAHIVDLLIGSLLTFIPFFIFDVSNLYAVAVIAIYKPIHNRFIHANLKINLGWLGLLVTSPQFHRVHHSIEPSQADKNFGVYFSIYDHLFGTAFPSRDVYPQTGIMDDRFPYEDKVRISQLPKNWVMQTVYPFVQIFEQIQSSLRLSLSRFREKMHHNHTESRSDSIGRQKESQRL
jgi:sterol desaturase/sphingolipid hydroxylase (fatty acid hydroxylase superfamily)